MACPKLLVSYTLKLLLKDIALKLITKPPNTRAYIIGKSLSRKTIFLPIKKTKTC